MSFRCPMLAILQGVNGFLLYKKLTVNHINNIKTLPQV